MKPIDNPNICIKSFAYTVGSLKYSFLLYKTLLPNGPCKPKISNKYNRYTVPLKKLKFNDTKKLYTTLP